MWVKKKKFGLLKCVDDQNESLLVLLVFHSLTLEREWVKGASVRGAATFPRYRCSATVTNAICEQACCSELPHISRNVQFAVCLSACVYVCVCGAFWRTKCDGWSQTRGEV